jgi:hypothetical protein
MKKMLNEGNQIHNFMSSSGSGTVINYGSGSGSDFLTNYGSGSVSGSTTLVLVVDLAGHELFRCQVENNLILNTGFFFLVICWVLFTVMQNI